MKTILDTHAVIWATTHEERLGKSARAFLAGVNAGEAAISDMTLLEIAMLVHKKRVVLSTALPRYLQSLTSYFEILPITPAIASTAIAVDLPQGDPFDRIIAASALELQIPLVTKDRHLREFDPLMTIWS